MADHYVSNSGVAYPDDLTLLKRVYDRICAERDLPHGCPEAAELAEMAMDLYRRAIFEEAALYGELNRI